jgi:hypothetical protein
MTVPPKTIKKPARELRSGDVLVRRSVYTKTPEFGKVTRTWPLEKGYVLAEFADGSHVRLFADVDVEVVVNED